MRHTTLDLNSKQYNTQPVDNKTAVPINAAENVDQSSSKVFTAIIFARDIGQLLVAFYA